MSAIAPLPGSSGRAQSEYPVALGRLPARLGLHRFAAAQGPHHADARQHRIEQSRDRHVGALPRRRERYRSLSHRRLRTEPWPVMQEQYYPRKTSENGDARTATI